MGSLESLNHHCVIAGSSLHRNLSSLLLKPLTQMAEEWEMQANAQALSTLVEDSASDASSRADWIAATELLGQMFQRSDGCVSSLALRKELERKGIGDARQLVSGLKFFDFDAPADDARPRPPLAWKHHGKSFYTEEAFRHQIKQRESEAENAANLAEKIAVETVEKEAQGGEEVRVRRKARQEEARLVPFVVDALSDLYASEFAGENHEVAFDVHSERPGNEFENVDAIAVHWRSADVVDLTCVEVKLDFNARAVQQAHNYTRFADRVWIAVPVQAQLGQAAVELREKDPRLFEYVIASGIGILGCRRARGRVYEVFALQWPRRCTPDPVERDAFIERHHGTFEDAGAVAPRARTRLPRLR
ncbi:MAG TPA: hypothetical protein VH374_16140 [Polyangia bacterium]|jgi:hypothetical protein|nr:hypothetical protein [Polyangia bacterium]